MREHMMSKAIWALDATETARLIKSKQLSARETVEDWTDDAKDFAAAILAQILTLDQKFGTCPATASSRASAAPRPCGGSSRCGRDGKTRRIAAGLCATG